MKTYVVTAFDGEGTSVLGVFSTREKAGAAVAEWSPLSYDKWEVMEWEVDSTDAMRPEDCDSFDPDTGCACSLPWAHVGPHVTENHTNKGKQWANDGIPVPAPGRLLPRP